MSIQNVSISTKNVDIAWITFNCEHVVKNIFKHAAIKQTGNLNIFPVISDCVLERKKDHEEIFKNLHSIDHNLRYQT